MKRRRLIAFASVILAACTDGGRSSGPSFAISDAVTGDIGSRNPHFFWLPPLVPSPDVTGDFNPFANPVVTVCQLTLTGTACATDLAGNAIVVARFTMTSGTGSEVIRVSNDDQLYIVNWHTDLSNLDPDFDYRVTVSVDGKDMGFADVEVGLTGNELRNINRDEFVPLVDGRTLPIKFRINAGAGCVGVVGGCVEAIVDPDILETLVVLDNGVSLAFGEFPIGWTNEPQLVRIERIPDGDFGPGEGPLGTDFPQYPLFFEYNTSAPEPFNLPVRIGVCNVGEPEESEYHPHHRPGTVLAMGGTPAEFRTLEKAPTFDVLGDCEEAARQSSGLGLLPRSFDELAARAGVLTATLLAPRELQASAMVVDGGAGGETDFFTPAGTVDTTSAAADLVIESLTHSPAEPTDADLMEFGVTVRNAGTAATGPFYVIVTTTADGIPTETTTLGGLATEGSSLAAGESRTLCCWRAFRAAGEYTQTASADFHTQAELNNQVPESNENNNSGTDRYSVSPASQLLLDFDVAPAGGPLAPGTIVNGLYATQGVSFSRITGIGQTFCGTQGNVYANSHGPLPGGGFGLRDGNNSVTVCPQGIAADFSEALAGRIQAAWTRPASEVCVAVTPTTIGGFAFIEAFGATGELLTRVQSAPNERQSICATGTGITRVQFAGASATFAIFDNLSITY